MTPKQKQTQYYANLTASNETSFMLEIKAIRAGLEKISADIDSAAAARRKAHSQFMRDCKFADRMISRLFS